MAMTFESDPHRVKLSQKVKYQRQGHFLQTLFSVYTDTHTHTHTQAPLLYRDQ